MAVRLALLLFLTFSLSGQLKERPAPSLPVTEGLVDEDEDLLPETEYVFNPIQAQKDLKVGRFYAKRGSHRAAAARFLEATKWDPTLAEAYYRLGLARQELKQPAEALEAYQTLMKLDPKNKWARAVGREITALERSIESLPLAASDQ